MRAFLIRDTAFFCIRVYLHIFTLIDLSCCILSLSLSGWSFRISSTADQATSSLRLPSHRDSAASLSSDPWSSSSHVTEQSWNYSAGATKHFKMHYWSIFRFLLYFKLDCHCTKTLRWKSLCYESTSYLWHGNTIFESFSGVNVVFNWSLQPR